MVTQSGISVTTFYEPASRAASALMSRAHSSSFSIGILFAPAQSPPAGEVVRWCSLEVPEVKPPLTIDSEMTVDEIMRRWPATIRVFIRNRMLCIGCPIGVFHTVKDACAAHDLDEESLSRELLAAMTSDDLVSGPSAFETA